MDICIPNMSTFIQEHCQLLTLDLKLPVILNQAPLGKFPCHYLCHILSLCANCKHVFRCPYSSHLELSTGFLLISILFRMY